MITTGVILYQQQLGSELKQPGIDVDKDAMYLAKGNIAMIWPYDDRGREPFIKPLPPVPSR